MEKKLNLSDDKVYANLLAYLNKQDCIQVAERGAYEGETVVLGNDWNDSRRKLCDFIETFSTLKDVSVGFYDEWMTCDADDCRKAIHREDDHVRSSHGDTWCEECCLNFIDEIIEDRMNCEDRAWYQFLDNDLLTERGWKPCQNCEDKQSGMHPGMNDTPQGVIKEFCEDNELEHINDAYDYIFVVNSSNPFAVNYSMWIKEKEL